MKAINLLASNDVNASFAAEAYIPTAWAWRRGLLIILSALAYNSGSAWTHQQKVSDLLLGRFHLGTKAHDVR